MTYAKDSTACKVMKYLILRSFINLFNGQSFKPLFSDTKAAVIESLAQG